MGDDPDGRQTAVNPNTANEPVVVRFMQSRLGIFFADTKLGDVVVMGLESTSEASGCAKTGMVLTHVAGKRIHRSMPTAAVYALLQQKQSRPLTLVFSSHRRCADMSHGTQTKLCRAAPSSGELVPPARLVRPTLAKSSRTQAVRSVAGWRLCVRPRGSGSNGSARALQRPAGVLKEEWQLALDASDLLCRRRIFNRWRRKYVESSLSTVFKCRWTYRMLLRTMHAWWQAVEDSLTTSWLLGLSLSRWRNMLMHMAFNQWLNDVGRGRPDGLCAEYSQLHTDERRERALEEPARWQFDRRTVDMEASAVQNDIKRFPHYAESHVHGNGDGSSLEQASVAEAGVSSSDEETDEDDTSNVNNEDKNRTAGSKREPVVRDDVIGGSKRSSGPKSEPEPVPETWLSSVFGAVPACCVAD